MVYIFYHFLIYINGDLQFIDWIEFLRKQTNIQQIFHNPLKEAIITAWSIWNRKNKIILDGITSNRQTMSTQLDYSIKVGVIARHLVSLLKIW